MSMTPIRFTALFLAAALAVAPVRAQETDLSNAFAIPGTDSQMKIYGWVQVYGQYCFNQSLYDNGTLIGSETDGRNASATPDKQFSLTARTSRFGLTTATPSRFGDVVTNLELAFSAGKPSAKGNPKLSQAWIGLGGWAVGYTWSNWINWDAQPETVDASGPIGQTSFDTGKFTQVRYVWRPHPSHTWSLSVEANQRAFKDWTGDNPNPKKPDGTHEDTIRPDSRWPSVVAAYSCRRDWGQVSLRALEQQYGAYRPPTDDAPSARPGIWGGAVQLSGQFRIGRQDTFVYSVYTGEGLGVYGFNPQGIQWGTNLDRTCLYRSTGWQTGYTHHWNGRVRSNLIATGLHFKHNAAVADTDVKRSENYFANTIVKLTRTLEWGLEYGYEGIKTFGGQAITQEDGAKGGTNRSNKLQMTLTAKF
jgi:hypothetical protein